MEHVLTMVVRVEKNARPAQTDALETAARAVLAILADERSVGEGEWAEAMTDWQDHQIRKIVKRARGAEWRRTENVPGITMIGTSAGADSPDEVNAAQVRVFPPTTVMRYRWSWRSCRSVGRISRTRQTCPRWRPACRCCG
ncbi:hypothetical protein [Kribbella solani]|uniref:hypothetical protein n=1 Tax=Kribbella solani TaxID=236067 RepID=UPI0029A5580A|nr:hypothetical protein [Kribbella solani]MDX2973864.1 hypothetical protein [Kribbella solani]